MTRIIDSDGGRTLINPGGKVHIYYRRMSQIIVQKLYSDHLQSGKRIKSKN